MKKKINNYLNRNFNKKRGDDKLSKENRSILMSKIKSRGTKLEEDFIKEFKKHTKKKFRLNTTDIKGKPDIVFDKDKICIFLDSDFWHGWQYPRWKHLLKNDFWRAKIENNRARDKKTTAYLRRQDWRVIRIWEHVVIKDKNKIIRKIEKFLLK